MASVLDVSLPLCAGEDTFELHAVQLELEAVERQIRILLEKQAELRERQTALETSRADAHQPSGPSTKNAFIPALVHSGAVTPGTLGASAAEGASQASDQDLSSTAPGLRRLDTEPLLPSSRGRTRRRGHRRLHRPLRPRYHCFPGARVLDVSVQIPAILNGAETIGAVVLHAGVNDTRLRQTEVLKQDFRSLIETVRATSPATKIIVSGPLPTYRRGHERLFRADGLHPSSIGADLLSENISKTLRTI
ncbi:uncharacterized protein LOC125275520 isoform X2 [Megalobrama amblycephala]|uniref:uncharacterized protein LOC125275520 isoform X2 n=1 Tax=Megalobrama amblycephala TaxID=75352 RepID=UPI002013D05A|nr:uncharacterized protein LOC125275520 isoform X2 [Megalobrama amblycephala]XP_048058488.1 uncharacterized protein LOC125275520 isoform X2 [Megalobrama amblycephala]XP_048058489.1 uncharacterized protein LOC125275520 isoform X2 [Megalobrama amblycephala]XP_048058490.1 uncharacterized protein LOC125275520 isoform X2 [Megalobrama amblycephala]